MIAIYIREKRKEWNKGTTPPQTLATTGLVYVPNNGTKGNNNGTNRYFKRKGYQKQ